MGNRELSRIFIKANDERTNVSYQPIEKHGLIGDMHTAALVGMNGSIDWLCLPDFDSPSVFASILDDKIGGEFRIAPVDEDVAVKQYYLPVTNVLVTRFMSNEGVVELMDFMPIRDESAVGGRSIIVRRVTGIRGRIRMRMICDPAFNYARDSHDARVTRRRSGGESQDNIALFASNNIGIGLRSTIPLEVRGDGAACEFECVEKQRIIFVLGQLTEHDPDGSGLSAYAEDESLKRTIDYWRNWISGCTYTGRWREMVHRSALALKLLTYEPTGAMVAAPTTSLPETPGGVRNWDYRYTWIRDASFTVYAFLRIGFRDEAIRFMEWIQARCEELESGESLRIMYGIDGRADLPEQTLDHLEGYEGARPVRIGNDASNQIQLDIYGELLDCLYSYDKHVSPISHDLWLHMEKLVDWVCDNWHIEDEGIWEVRGGRRHFVYSKVMCWVAVHRALRMATARGFPIDREKWERVQGEIYTEIMERGWNEELKSFTQSYDGDTLDASNLSLSFLFFLSPTDPRFLSTLDAIMKAPSEGGLLSNGLVYRYNVEHADDGLEGEEGAFSICTFWLVEALTRSGQTDRGRLEKARLIFEQMLGYANHLGLYAEEIGPLGQALGNFPQAFTHVSLISSAFNLDRALGAGA